MERHKEYRRLIKNMELKDLKNFTKIIRDEVDSLPNNFIMDEPRKEGQWVGSEHLKKVVDLYSSGRCGWLKGGQNHVPDDWISWPLIWDVKPVVGNCANCPKTYKMLSDIGRIQVAGFSLMKGGVRLKSHTDDVGPKYKFTYHLGIKVPEGKCLLHHSTSGDFVEKDGRHIILDARQPHWAENLSNEDRIILYMEII